MIISAIALAAYLDIMHPTHHMQLPAKSFIDILFVLYIAYMGFSAMLVFECARRCQSIFKFLLCIFTTAIIVLICIKEYLFYMSTGYSYIYLYTVLIAQHLPVEFFPFLGFFLILSIIGRIRMRRYQEDNNNN